MNYSRNHNSTHSEDLRQGEAEHATKNSVLDFQYTAFAVKVAPRMPRRGRVDRSKLSRRRLGPGPGSLKQPSKGYMAFERWNGNSSILQYEDGLDVEGGTTSVAAEPCDSGRDSSQVQHLEALMLLDGHNQLAVQSLSHPSSDQPEQAEMPLDITTPATFINGSVMQMGLDGGSGSDMLVMSTPASRSNQAGPSSLYSAAPSSSRTLSYSYSSQERILASSTASAWTSRAAFRRSRHGVESETSASASSTRGNVEHWPSTEDIHRKTDRSPAGAQESRGVQSTKCSSPWLEGGGPEEAQGAGCVSSSQLLSASQARLVGGSHALGLSPRTSACDPVLKEALEAHEPQDVRRCVSALRRCLGGISVKRAAAMVRTDPRLIDMTERDMMLQVSLRPRPELLTTFTTRHLPSFVI